MTRGEDGRVLLTLQGVHGGYARRTIVHGIELLVRAGQVVAIVGANGSGKSTLLRTISGTAELSAGHVLLDGHPIDHLPPWRRFRRGLCHVPQRAGLFLEMTVEENLSLCARMAGGRHGESLPRLLEDLFADLPMSGLLSRRVNTLSGGERQLAVLARAFISRPRVLLIDEPTQGLAERLVAGVLSRLRSVAVRLGVAVLLVEHRVVRALEVADSALALRSGEVVWQGTASALRSAPDILADVFGLTAPCDPAAQSQHT